MMLASSLTSAAQFALVGFGLVLLIPKRMLADRDRPEPVWQVVRGPGSVPVRVIQPAKRRRGLLAKRRDADGHVEFAIWDGQRYLPITDFHNTWIPGGAS